MGQYTQVDPIGLAGGNPTLYGYVKNTLMGIDPFGLLDLQIPGAIGELAIHANPGPNVAGLFPGSPIEHSPAHIHLGSSNGPRVNIRTFEPFSPEDARKMTPKQKRYIRGLSNQNKNLIRKRAKNVFEKGVIRGCG